VKEGHQRGNSGRRNEAKTEIPERGRTGRRKKEEEQALLLKKSSSYFSMGSDLLRSILCAGVRVLCSPSMREAFRGGRRSGSTEKGSGVGTWATVMHKGMTGGIACVRTSRGGRYVL